LGVKAAQHVDRVGLDTSVAGIQYSDDDSAEYENTSSTMIALRWTF
jgi:hypothetical protein